MKEHSPLHIWSGADWWGHDVPPLEWVVPGIIPARTVTMISGDGAVGKSLIACQLAICATVDKPWLGKVVHMACDAFGGRSRSETGCWPMNAALTNY